MNLPVPTRPPTQHRSPTRTSFMASGAQLVLPIVAGILAALSGRLDAQPALSGWQQGLGYRARPLAFATPGRTGFLKMEGAGTGVLFTNQITDDRSIKNRNLLSGSGVAAGDFDGDGWCDLYFCGLDNLNVLFRNRGNWKFEDVTAQAGVGCAGQDSTGAAFADVDGDGRLDLLVNSLGGGTRLFRNEGQGQFRETTAQAGLSSRAGSMSLALADIEGDGDLDLYVANFRQTTIKDRPQTNFRIQMVDGRPLVALVDGRPATAPDLTNRFEVSPSGNILEFGQADTLYLNDGQGHFTPVFWTGGTFLDEDGAPLAEAPRDWSLAVLMSDLTGDGAPDIYVCSDLFTPDRIWINDGKGKFRALDYFSLRSTSTFSMGVDFADIDRDGRMDFFVVDMFSRERQKQHVQMTDSKPAAWPIGLIEARPQLVRNTLQWNRGDGSFAEIAWYAGLEASDWSWGPIFLDIDLDGYEDILVTNGQLRDFQNIDLTEQMEAAKAARKFTEADLLDWVKRFPRLDTPNLIFRNRGDLTFEEVGSAWGFATPGISQGMALADLDNDGDMDVAMNNLLMNAGLYQNTGGAPRVAVRLNGSGPNSHGTGARIEVLGGPVAQSQQIICGGRYLSGDDAMRVFAAGTMERPLTIQVTWRSGRQTRIERAQPNLLYEIEEANAVAASSRKETPPSPMFQETSSLVGHQHAEEPFDDFERQPLLPNRLSQGGPGVCWTDLDGDGWDDLFIGSGKGGALGIFRNNTQGGFVSMRDPDMSRVTTRDQTTILGAGGQLYLGLSNYEDGLTNGICARMIDFQNRAGSDTFAAQRSSAGPMTLGDIDADGDLDLFIGGRTIPGRYPEAATSVLLRNENGKFQRAQSFEKVGLVSGAVLSDLTGDGLPDLALACEWGPVRVFRNDKGNFVEATGELGLAGELGWWNGVASGDFDGDGRLDLAASNWGLNTKYRASPERPRKLYYGDLSGRGAIDLIEAQLVPELGKEAPERNLRAIGAVFPMVRGNVKSFEAYGSAGLPEIFGPAIAKLPSVSATTLASKIFLNRGGRFEARSLPREAQFTPAFAVCVGDLDGDGREDVFLSQNFFAVNPELNRNDGGRGLWLRGDGQGGWMPAGGQVSGIKVYGEQRGAALADYDGDGRVDLVVTQNGNETKLFRNVAAAPGLRVRVNAGPKNRPGIGALLRLKFGSKFGPAREVQAGSGYWSQNSPTQVLGLPQVPTQIWIRWPGGKETVSPIPEGAREIEVLADGTLRRIK